MQRIFIVLLSLHFALYPAHASQNALMSPTTGTVSGLQLTNNYNNALDSLNTFNSGTTAPTNQLSGSPSLGNRWIDTTASPYPVHVYDGANWLTPYFIDATNHYTDVKIGGGVATIASASTVDLCSGVPQNYITISGTTTVISFGGTCGAGAVKIVTFSGILTLTYNATSLIIPGGANVITSAGDQAVVVALGSGNWQVISYTPASGQALINAAVDVGDVIFTFATAPPSAKYLFAYGQAISRTTYATLLADITITQSVTRTNGSPTLTGFSDTTQIPIGACIEGSGIPNSGSCTTSVLSCTTSTCTLSQNANSSGTANVQIFPNGNGDGATTFNLPHCDGNVLVGRNNMSGSPSARLSTTYFGTGPNALGAQGGGQSQTASTSIGQTNLPSVNFAVSGITLNNPSVGVEANTCGQGSNLCTGGSATAYEQSATSNATGPTNLAGGAVTTSVSVNSQGSAASGGSGTAATSAAFSIVQPSLTANCMMRVLSKLETPPLDVPSSIAANDDLPIADRRRAA